MTLSAQQFGNQFRSSYESEHGSARVTPGGYVYNVGIRPQSRGEGHGTALMGQIISHADEMGRELSLHAREDLHPWYHRLGFQETPDPTKAKMERDIMGQPLLVRPARKRP
jgi:ribosomal protein S18 acetylase RimI-like enzyme